VAKVPPKILVLNRQVIASFAHWQTKELRGKRDHLKVITENSDTGKGSQGDRDRKEFRPIA